MDLKRILFYSLILAFACMQLSACWKDEPDPIIEPPSRMYVAQGKNLTKGLAACGFCHGETISPSSPLSGGRMQYDNHGEVGATNITPSESGIKNWNSLQFIKLFRSRLNPQGDHITPQLHSGFEWMSEADILSIFSYLKTLPPVENSVDRRSLGIITRNTTGLFDSDAAVVGFVPDIEKSYQAEYGEYLADHVARCSSCHNTPSTTFGSEKYWAGGAVIENEYGEKVAPNITSSKTSGIGAWSEDDVVNYLKSGSTPRGAKSDEHFCPVGYYQNALPEDLITLAKYIKAVQPIDNE